jgi:hypothetical protein
LIIIQRLLRWLRLTGRGKDRRRFSHPSLDPGD